MPESKVKNGYKYQYKLRKKFYDADDNLYTTSEISTINAVGWATMEKPTIRLTKNAAGDLVVEQQKNNNKFQVYKSVNGAESVLAATIEQGGQYVDSVVYDKHNIGKAVEYKIKTINTYTGLESAFSDAVDTFYMIYSPKYAAASQGEFTDRVEVEWQWGSADQRC